MPAKALGPKRSSRELNGDVCDANCPARVILDHVTSRWSCLILVMLLERTHRFSELGKRIGGVSERMLAHTLKTLADDGLVLRTVYPTKPPSVEYALSAPGEELATHVAALTVWIEQNVTRVGPKRVRQPKASR